MDVGTLSAARSSPRAAAACWTAESSSARAYAPGAGPGRHLLGQLLGEAVQFGDGGGVGVVRLEGAALAGERGPAHGGDAVQVAAQRGGRVGVGAQFLDLPVDAGARAARLGALALGRPAAM